MSILASSGTAHVREARVLDDEVPEFDVLYRRWFRFTWSVLRRLGVPEPAIEDAAQEVWVIVHRRLDALESPQATRSWLFQIARRVAARHRRGEQRSRRKLSALGWLPQRTHQPHADRDSMLTVETLLGRIDERKREAFVLSELEGWSAPEIAKAVGTNPNTVYSRIRLARAELRAGWEARCRSDDLDDALCELRTRTRPPKGAAKRCWLLLAPKLALGSKVAATGLGVGAVASWKLVVAGAAVLGLAAVGGSIRAERRPPSAERRAAAAVREPASPLPEASRSSVPVAAPPASPDVVEPPVAAPLAAASAPSAPPTDSTATGSSSTTARARREPSRAPSPPSPGLADETELLTAAQSSLAAAEPERALAQLAEHRTRFTASSLADLRTLLEIKALCAAGREADASSKLRNAEAAMPGSALLPKMQRARQSCGG